MSVPTDLTDLFDHGWVRLAGAVPVRICRRLVAVLDREFGVPVRDPSLWAAYGEQDLVPIWGHQAQWDIRQHPYLHRVWASLWGTERLCVSLDSCRFTPPWRRGHAEPYGIHWDHDPWDTTQRMFQGVLALTDTAPDQGGFRYVPSLWRDRDAWPERPIGNADGDQEWLADTTGREIVHVPARTGDLIVWDSRLPHGNSKNLASRPRIAFYVLMGPVDERLCQAGVESWRTGRCVPWWRDRPGYDRVEPWPSARLTPLGRRLLGLERWP